MRKKGFGNVRNDIDPGALKALIRMYKHGAAGSPICREAQWNCRICLIFKKNIAGWTWMYCDMPGSESAKRDKSPNGTIEFLEELLAMVEGKK